MKKYLVCVLTVLLSAVLMLSGCHKDKDREKEQDTGSDTAASSNLQSQDVLTENTEEPSEEPSSDVSYAVLKKVTSRVNFRSQPDVNSESFGVLDTGTLVTVLSEGESWDHVSFNGQEGYIANEYLAPSGEQTASQQPVTPPETQPTQPYTPSQDPSSAQGSFSVPLYQDPNNGLLADCGLFSVAGLPNKSIPYGNDWDDKDETGLPNGVHYYESLYSKYYPVYRIKTAEKLLYLTMDEGYEAGYTPVILDILKEKNVKAVFFLTKQFVDSDPELVQRMVNEGHILGNHTCAHPSGGYPLTVDANGIQCFIDDVSKLHKMVYDQFGYTMRLFRFPEGESSELLMAELCNLGYTSVFWSYAHKDYVLTDQPEVGVTLDRCLSHMAPGAVYLLHAVSESNTYALADFIDQARAAGYEFGVFPVDQVSAR